mgnify:CR=1 FL=1
MLCLTAAGSSAGALTAEQGFFRGDRKALLPAVINKVHLHAPALGGQVFINQIGQALNFIAVVIVFWFIQNQAQAGAASAAALQINAQGAIQIFLRHKGLDSLAGAFSNFYHWCFLSQCAKCNRYS